MNKECSLCKKVKFFDLFYSDADKEDGRTTRCKECVSQSQKARYKDNPKAWVIRSKKYYEENTIKIKEKAQKYYHTNKHTEKLQEGRRKYRQENKGYLNGLKKLYKIQKTQAIPKWLTDWDEFVLREIYDLSRMRTDSTGIEWHVDHIIPLKGKEVCGLHIPNNLQVIPAVENLSKGNKYAV